MSFDSITLECFIATAQEGSFTKAARKVSRTQSAVSQQINKLEIMLAKQLFTRGKILSLTYDGEIFLSYARQIFALQQETIQRFKKPDLEGEVRFGLPENFASIYLSEFLVDFARVHPGILLNIECDLTLNLFDKFKRKELDLVLVKMNRPEDFSNGLDVWSEPLIWAGDYGLICKDKPLPLVLSPHPCVYRTAAINALTEAGRAWRLVFSSTSYASTLAAVKAGMGITVMPYTMVPPDLEFANMQSLSNKILPALPDTHVSLLKHSAANAAVNTLENFVLRKLKH